MENEELIRKQMDETRLSISEKLETLENKVSGDIQGATGAVTGTVEAVKDTVESVKDSVTETVESVKEAVAETTETVKESVKEGLNSVAHWLDIPSHVRNYPWMSVGVAAGAGFLLESMLVSSGDSRERSTGAPPFSSARGYTSAGAASAPSAPSASSSGGGRSTLSSLMSMFGPQMGMLRQIALSALFNAVKEPVLKAMPTQREGLTQLFDSLSEKLGVDSTDSASAGSGGSNGAHSGYSSTGDSAGATSQFGRSRTGSPMGGSFGEG